MARLHAILFVIRMCGCWMLLLYLHKYFLAYFYVSHPMIKYGRHLTVHLHRRRSRGGQKIYFSFRKHEKVTYWWNVCSERKKKPLCCLKNVIFVCSANCKFPSSLQETVPPPKKIITLKSQIEIFFSWTRQNHKIILKVSSGWWIKKK